MSRGDSNILVLILRAGDSGIEKYKVKITRAHLITCYKIEFLILKG